MNKQRINGNSSSTRRWTWHLGPAPFACFGLAIMFTFASSLPIARAASSSGLPFKALLFSKTAGYRHPSIPDGVAAIQQLAATNNFVVVATENATVFSDSGLAPYQVVIFLLTSGDILTVPQQGTLTRFIQSGHGFVGIHSACDTEYTWPWYGSLMGAYYKSHPAVQTATVRVEDFTHPSTSFLPSGWVRSDEWYDYNVNPRTNDPSVHVLARLDESTYTGGAMGTDHPIAWYHEFDGGRAWYTGGGHTSESYAEPLFRLHLLGGIRYAAGALAFPPPCLNRPTQLASGAVQLTFTNSSAASFSVLRTADIAAPVSTWTLLGTATPLSNGVYQFLDPVNPTSSQWFYQLQAR